ncbi:hypothetical protein VTN31DRAFT_680 [Thermomyces dupontii]|uniref:uncharacterized protein n=1 Tax=Talaromyces thermophilus TaxID=28565 RepID=UPI0037432BD2
MADLRDLRDLRSTALDTKRLHDHKAKWAYGVRDETVLTWYGQPKPVTYRNRPSRVERPRPFKRDIEAQKKADYTKFRRRFADDVNEVLRVDPFAEEPSSPHPFDTDASDVVYYDDDDGEARLRDITGNIVLAAAVARAEEKYETKLTEKLLKEYELVGKEEGEVRDGESSSGVDESDYEVVDHAELS